MFVLRPDRFFIFFIVFKIVTCSEKLLSDNEEADGNIKNKLNNEEVPVESSISMASFGLLDDNNIDNKLVEIEDPYENFSIHKNKEKLKRRLIRQAQDYTSLYPALPRPPYNSYQQNGFPSQGPPLHSNTFNGQNFMNYPTGQYSNNPYPYSNNPYSNNPNPYSNNPNPYSNNPNPYSNNQNPNFNPYAFNPNFTNSNNPTDKSNFDPKSSGQSYNSSSYPSPQFQGTNNQTNLNQQYQLNPNSYYPTPPSFNPTKNDNRNGYRPTSRPHYPHSNGSPYNTNNFSSNSGHYTPNYPGGNYNHMNYPQNPSMNPYGHPQRPGPPNNFPGGYTNIDYNQLTNQSSTISPHSTPSSSDPYPHSTPSSSDPYHRPSTPSYNYLDSYHSNNQSSVPNPNPNINSFGGYNYVNYYQSNNSSTTPRPYSSFNGQYPSQSPHNSNPQQRPNYPNPYQQPGNSQPPQSNGQYPNHGPSSWNPQNPTKNNQYPYQNTFNEGRNNFYYPSPSNATTNYDPRKVPPQDFSYHY